MLRAVKVLLVSLLLDAGELELAGALVLLLDARLLARRLVDDRHLAARTHLRGKGGVRAGSRSALPSGGMGRVWHVEDVTGKPLGDIRGKKEKGVTEGNAVTYFACLKSYETMCNQQLKPTKKKLPMSNSQQHSGITTLNFRLRKDPVNCLN